MTPTSRNTLMIGGALILISLLLVCGPLSGLLGSGGSSLEEAPSVAAGPPADHSGALGAAAVGALAGARLGESRAELLAAEMPVVVVAVPVIEVVEVVAEAEDETAMDATVVAPIPAELPDVGAVGPSISDVASPGLEAAVTAADFDRAMAAAAKTKAGVVTAGNVVDRFAPPVAAAPQANLRVAYSLDAGAMIMPCETPGSDCRNLAATSAPPPMGQNPPIIPGRLPPQPLGENPPIIPGRLPPQSTGAP
ncbi:MAG: hypothetical protein ABGX04_03445 [Myxococcales bacterium]|nr:hypothetical protein [Myxococcales bacterium]HIK86258.1 hypothetical protein [Myxococcales bacterium]